MNPPFNPNRCFDLAPQTEVKQPPKLRPYQRDIIDRFHEAIAAGKRRPLLVLPTGAGKTVVAAEIIKSAVATGQRVLFLAHRRELITQARDRLGEVGVDTGIILAGHEPAPEMPVQIGSIQTVWARAIRGSSIELPVADLLFIDEAHRARAMTYEKILARYPNAVIAGLTATPVRRDGRGLGHLFDCMIEGPQVQELIDGDFLVSTVTYAPVQPDLKGVRVEGGDYAIGELGERMDRAPLIGDIVTHWHKHSERRKTVCFATTVAHARHLCEEFQKSGVRAEYLHGGTPKAERDDMLKRLSAGELEIVVNCMVLCEGWDQPDVACVVLARPTKSLGLFRQMIGRGLRPAPGKTNLLVLDHAGGVFAHGFVEDPIDWSLDTDRRAANRVHQTRQSSHRSRLTDCPRCSALRTTGEACRSCGWKPEPKAEHFDVQDGELGRVDRQGGIRGDTYTPQEKNRWHGALWFIANERARSRPFNTKGWVYHKFVEKFGHKPPWGQPMPIEPSPEIRAWVRSRDIAYAKAMQRQRGAA